MVIWIDGTYGIGKTAVSMKIKEQFPDCEMEILESDIYAEETLKEVIEEAKKHNCMPDIGGTLPQNNIRFLTKFKDIIEERAKDENKKLLVDMSLTMKVCKENLFEVLVNKGIKIIHIILEADEETIAERIKKDGQREKMVALNELKSNLKFLDANYADAIRISTDNKSIEDIAHEVIQVIKSVEEKN